MQSTLPVDTEISAPAAVNVKTLQLGGDSLHKESPRPSRLPGKSTCGGNLEAWKYLGQTSQCRESDMVETT